LVLGFAVDVLEGVVGALAGGHVRLGAVALAEID
jgi:hypothetical protein